MPTLLHGPARLGTALLCLLLLVALAAALPRPSHSATGAPAFDPAGVQLHLMGRIEGPIRALDVAGGLLAVAGSSSLTFYDITDAAQPRVLSTLTLPDSSTAVQIEGDIVYVGWGSCTNPLSPSCAGGLDVYDLAMPTAPLRLARIIRPEVLSSIVVLGDTGYARGSQFYRLDLRDPSAPVLIPDASTDRWALVHLVERADLGGQRYAFVTNYRQIKVLNLETGQLVSEFALEGVIGSFDHIETLTTPDGRYIVAITEQSEGVYIVDLTNPAAPQPLTFVALPQSFAALAVVGPMLYISGHGDGLPYQLHALDLTDPAAPLLSELPPDLTPGSLAAEQDLLIVSDPDAITLYTLTMPGLLQQAGVIPLRSVGLADDADAAYANGHLYVRSMQHGLMAMDIRRPAAPPQRPTGLLAETNAQPVIVASGSYLLLGTYAEHWRLFDVTDPARPRLLSEIPLPRGIHPAAAVLDMSSGSPTAYLLTTACTQCPEPIKLRLYDLADPARPRALSTISLSAANKLAVHDGYAYLAYNDTAVGALPSFGGWLQVYDVRDRAAPRLQGRASFTGGLQDLVVADGRAYVAAWWGGLHTFSIEDPANPQLLSTYLSHREMQAYRVAVDGPTVFVSTLYDSELYSLDLSDPASPRLVERAKLPGTSTMLLLLGDQLVTAGSGVAIYQRGTSPASIVRDARGAPMPDVTLQLDAGLAQLTSGFQAQATDLGGSLNIDPASSAGALLTPSFRDAAFWPERRTVAEGAALDFILLAPPVTAAVTPGEAATLVLSDTQGLTSSLSLPPGALSAPSALTLRPLVVSDAWPLRFAGQGFALSLAEEGARFVEPAELRLRYSRADARLISQRSELALYRQAEGGWVPAEQGCPGAPAPAHDQLARELRVALCAPGEYALLGPSEHILLPLLGR
jgi:hypothetical protein